MSKLIKYEPQTLDDLNRIGQMCAKSGMFADIRDAAQAAIKIMAGQELGLGPMESMSSINVIQNKISM